MMMVDDPRFADLVTAMEQTADARSALHDGSPSQRKLTSNYDRCGLAGEIAFARKYKLPIDLEPRRDGDRGIDFWVPLFMGPGEKALIVSVDVKASANPGHLLVEPPKAVADIYVLCRYSGGIMDGELLKWEWGRAVKRAPIKDWYGKPNYSLKQGELQDMELLTQMIAVVGVNADIVGRAT